MMKNKKTYILLSIAILLIAILFFIKNQNNNNLQEKKIMIYNQNETFLQKQEEQGITFDDFQCYYDGEKSLISYVISNQTENTIKLNNYEVLVKDKDNNTISTIFVDANIELAPSQQKIGKNTVIGVDLSNAHKMELNLKTNDNTN